MIRIKKTYYRDQKNYSGRRKEGRKEGRTEGRKEGRKERRMQGKQQIRKVAASPRCKGHVYPAS